MLGRTFWACVSISLILAADPAAAQGSRVDPTQLQRDLDARRLERERERRTDPTIPMATPDRLRLGTQPLFKLVGVVIYGAVTLSKDEFTEIYQPYLGKTVSETDLSRVAEGITERYRAAGFHLSRAIVPPQDIKNGVVRVQVIEGRIAEVVLKGRDLRSRARQLLQSLTDEVPSRLPSLERRLLLVNDIPGYRVADTTLEEVGGATGSFRLTVYLETWSVQTGVGLDNRGVEGIGPLQAHLASSLFSYFLPGDAGGFSASTVPNDPRELSFGQLWYEAPVGLNGSRFGISGSYGEIRPNDERALVGTNTKSETFDARFTSVPLRSRNASLWFTVAAGFADITERDDTGLLYDDRIRTVAASLDYQHHDGGASNFATLTFRQGLDVFDASHAGDPFLSRGDGSGQFSKVEFGFTRIQKLSEVWSIRFSAAGQAASAPLLASQEFILGGQLFGRGYDTAELTGDHGIAASLEIRFEQKTSDMIVKGYQVYAFVDGGAVRNLRVADDSTESLASAGAGIRLLLAGELHADIGVAVPLTYRPPGNWDRSPRVFVLLARSFKLCPDQPRVHC
jgi:hemolysin activation/secretion protein